jgi:dTDP-4-amino-4,6-dideoxygalactose transaminase
LGRSLAGGRAAELPVTDATAARLLRLPLYASLSSAQVERIVTEVASYLRRGVAYACEPVGGVA